MSLNAKSLIEILKLTSIEEDTFQGESHDSGGRHVFGGLVLAQAIIAAGHTVDGKILHSIHAYFLRAGDPDIPITYEVERLREGKSFVARALKAYQHGKVIFTANLSFHTSEQGLEHQFKMPSVPMPETLPDKQAMQSLITAPIPKSIENHWKKEQPFDIRPLSLEHFFTDKKLPPQQDVWFKLNIEEKNIPNLQHLAHAVVAYLSDTSLLDTALFVHGTSIFNSKILTISVDHAIWFHRQPNISNWLLYHMDSPSTAHARSFSRGSIYTKDGALIASTAQEGLIRVKRPRDD